MDTSRMTRSGGDQVDVDPVLFAVVHFTPAAARQVREVVVMFESARAADHFARDHHLADYAVAPVSFCADLPTGRRPPPKEEQQCS